MKNNAVLLAWYADLHNQRCSQVQKAACRPSCHRFCCMWAGRGLYPNIIKTVSKHNNTYADTRGILCFFLITFSGAMQAVWVLTFNLQLLLQPDSGTIYLNFCSPPFFFSSSDIFLLRASKLKATKQLTWRPRILRNWITIWLSPFIYS